MAKPNSKAALGSGGRFAALESKLSNRPGVSNPGALAAAIGRAKYGSGRFQQMSVAARKRKKGKQADSEPAGK